MYFIHLKTPIKIVLYIAVAKAIRLSLSYRNLDPSILSPLPWSILL